ncbi:MAG: SdpI family protein [Clostridia bacterium]|nr:SdpI family protein [Clostridia bacterium]
MIKKNLWRALLSSLLIVAPMGYGLLAWESLPSRVPVHMQLSGTADGFAGKGMLVFWLPLLLLAFHWLALGITAIDQRRHPQSQKATRVLFWIIPLLSLATNGIMYGLARGKEFRAERLLPILFGVLFIILGNVMPTLRKNHTFGLRIRTTLGNEENWNKTHRFSGKIWVAGGFAVLLTALLPVEWMVVCAGAILVVLCVAPIVYSYCLYRQHRREGIDYSPVCSNKTLNGLGIALSVVLLAGVAILMFTGEVEVTYGEDAFTIDSIYCQAVEVDYDRVESVEYRESYPTDERVLGFGSARLLLGSFRNEEFGIYSRYTYTGNRPCVVMWVDGKVLVVGGKDASQTQEIYNTLLQHGAGD